MNNIVAGIMIALVCYNIGYYIGGNSVLRKQDSVVIELQEQNHKKELEYTAKIEDLKYEVETIKTSYSNSISELNKSASDGMRKSEARAEYYRQQAESCSAQSRDFAEYTAKLDRQLTEGISLVRELTELIRYRDKQLEQVGNQLRLDRELINK